MNQGSRKCICFWWCKKMSVLMNFLMRNTNLVSFISKFCPNFKFYCSCLTGVTNFTRSLMKSFKIPKG